MRQVTPGPQKSTVSTLSSSLLARNRESGSSERPTGSDRTFSVWALLVALVAGILLGLLMAMVISAFVDGNSSSRAGAGSSTSASPSASASSARDALSHNQQQDAIRADQAEESRDVRITACGSDTDGYASARVLISNGTDSSATYYVHIIFASAANGGIVSDDVASARHLAPGTSAPIQTVHSIDRSPPEGVICRLGGVSRF
jgi:hypothetical protein